MIVVPEGIAPGNTSTGTDELVFVPLPSCPTLLRPQAYIFPVELSATVWLPPVEIAGNDVPAGIAPADGATGLVDCVVLPVPNCPVPLSPQPRGPPTAPKPKLGDVLALGFAGVELIG